MRRDIAWTTAWYFSHAWTTNVHNGSNPSWRKTTQLFNPKFQHTDQNLPLAELSGIGGIVSPMECDTPVKKFWMVSSIKRPPVLKRQHLLWRYSFTILLASFFKKNWEGCHRHLMHPLAFWCLFMSLSMRPSLITLAATRTEDNPLPSNQ